MSVLIRQLEEQKKIEMGPIAALTPGVEAVGHPLVKVLLKSIVLDSGKHAAICQALIDVNAGEVPVLLDMGLAVSLHQKIKQHVRAESQMISRLEIMVDEAKDDRVKALLRYMWEDEKRHHRILKNMSNLLDRDDAPFDEYMELFEKFMIVPPS